MRSLSRNRNERVQVHGGEAAPANAEWTESQMGSRQEGFIQRRGQSAQGRTSTHGKEIETPMNG